MSYNITEVQNWISSDPDEKTRAELTKLLEQAENGEQPAIEELSDRFSSFLQFGTAGLRGAMAAGPFRMNRAVVRKAAAGLAAFLLEKVGSDALVVIGFDARYNSRDFAHDTAAIITAAGMRAKIMPRELPTPLLAYSVRQYNADAGVMVTASHNPAQDNGYKVYLGGRCTPENGKGVQLVPPYDAEIAEKIAATGPANDIPLQNGYETISEELIDSYISECAGLAQEGPRDLSIVYTAMHGVGTSVMTRIFEEAGFGKVTLVSEQCTPDPDFPTVAFPNPEEAGALDLAIATAERVKADLIIASDPDADRCSAAVPTAQGWKQLSGDEIGSILGEYLAGFAQKQYRESGVLPYFANSIVSSRLLGRIAQSHGLGHTETLTGFKWIARVPDIAFGYEEAIGFCVNPMSVRDKDGLSAGIVLASLCASLKERGHTLLDVLDDLYQQHGVYLTAPVTVRVDDLSIIGRTMTKVRSFPPEKLAGSRLIRSLDLREGSDDLPPTDAIVWYTQDNDRVVIRPSGTEPKVKCYLEVCVPVTEEESLVKAKETATLRLSQLKTDVSEALHL